MSLSAPNYSARLYSASHAALNWIQLSPLYALLLGALAALTSIYDYHGLLRSIGQVIAGLILFFMACLLLSGWLAGSYWPSALRPTLAWVAAYIGLYCIGFVVQGSFSGFRYSVLSAILYFMLFAALANIRYTNSSCTALGWCFSIFICLIGAWWLAVGLPKNFAAHMTNPNQAGCFFGLSLYFILLALHVRQTNWHRLQLVGVAVLTVVMTAASESRSIMLGLIAMAVIYYSWRWLVAKRWRFEAVFWVVVALIMIITIITPIIYMFPYYSQINNVSSELFGKRLQSGRQVVWAVAFNLIRTAPIFGHGPHYLLKNIIDTTYSAHNLYLQVALQIGLLGVVVLLGLLNSIWRVFWQGRHDSRVRLAAGFTIALLIHQTFEVSLTQNSLSSGLIMWMILGTGAGLALNSARQVRQPAPQAGKDVA